MHLTEDNCYHIYNRGNNKQPIFFSEDNYVFFLQKVKRYIYPISDILSWCLMPTHFHILIHANINTVSTISRNGIEIQQFSENIRLLLSSYTKAINKQNKFSGNLFQQKTKAKEIDLSNEHQLIVAFHYIHQNAYKAGLVKKMEDWNFSSFKDYMNIRNGKLCNKVLTKQLIPIDDERFYEDSYKVISNDKMLTIF